MVLCSAWVVGWGESNAEFCISPCHCVPFKNSLKFGTLTCLTQQKGNALRKKNSNWVSGPWKKYIYIPMRDQYSFQKIVYSVLAYRILWENTHFTYRFPTWCFQLRGKRKLNFREGEYSNRSKAWFYLKMIGTRASLDLDLRCQKRGWWLEGNVVLKSEQKCQGLNLFPLLPRLVVLTLPSQRGSLSCKWRV